MKKKRRSVDLEEILKFLDEVPRPHVGDFISGQMYKAVNEYLHKVRVFVTKVSTPEAVGEWKFYSIKDTKPCTDMRCSCCHKVLFKSANLNVRLVQQEYKKIYKYCPFCGARMKGA